MNSPRLPRLCTAPPLHLPAPDVVVRPRPPGADLLTHVPRRTAPPGCPDRVRTPAGLHERHAAAARRRAPPAHAPSPSPTAAKSRASSSSLTSTPQPLAAYRPALPPITDTGSLSRQCGRYVRVLVHGSSAAPPRAAAAPSGVGRRARPPAALGPCIRLRLTPSLVSHNSRHGGVRRRPSSSGAVAACAPPAGRRRRRGTHTSTRLPALHLTTSSISLCSLFFLQEPAVTCRQCSMIVFQRAA